MAIQTKLRFYQGVPETTQKSPRGFTIQERRGSVPRFLIANARHATKPWQKFLERKNSWNE